MSVRTPDRPASPPLSDDVIASYMRGRGDIATPEGLLAAARTHALQPVGIPRLRLALALTVALAAVPVSLLVLALPLRQTPTTPVSALVAPSRELVLATHDATGDVLLRPADPSTALPLEGLEPIRVTQPFELVLSPDGRTLAVVTTPPYAIGDGGPVRPDSGLIRLIDLESWAVSETPVTGLSFVRELTWTPDSRALVWFAPTHTDQNLVNRAYRVMRWVIGSAAPEALVDLPDPALVPWEARIMVDPQRIPRSVLAVVATPRDASERWSGSPHVLTIDLEHPRVVADIDLQDAGPGGASPAITWDMPRQRAFLATQDTLLTVDLRSISVTAQSIEGAGSSASRPGTVLWGELSPDGGRLYLTGVTQTQTDGGIRYDPVGLRVIDTRDGSLVAAPDPTISQVTLDPTADRLLMASWATHDASPIDQADGEVRVADPDTLDVLARIPAPDGASMPHPIVMSTTWDGRSGYIGSYIRGNEDTHTEVQVIDLENGRVIEQRSFGGREHLVGLFVLGGGCGGVAGC